MLVTRTYLEMTVPGQLLSAGDAPEGARVDPIAPCPPSFYRYLYGEVGREWHWVDRLDWDDESIRTHLAQRSVTLWLLTMGDAPAGWFELKGCDDGSTEIAYFGILPAFRRRGLGSTCSPRRCAGRGVPVRTAYGCTPARWTIPPPCRTTSPGASVLIRRRPIRLICRRFGRIITTRYGDADEGTHNT